MATPISRGDASGSCDRPRPSPTRIFLSRSSLRRSSASADSRRWLTYDDISECRIAPVASSGHRLSFEEANPNMLLPLVTITSFDVILMLREVSWLGGDLRLQAAPLPRRDDRSPASRLPGGARTHDNAAGAANRRCIRVSLNEQASNGSVRPTRFLYDLTAIGKPRRELLWETQGKTLEVFDDDEVETSQLRPAPEVSSRSTFGADRKSVKDIPLGDEVKRTRKGFLDKVPRG